MPKSALFYENRVCNLVPLAPPIGVCQTMGSTWLVFRELQVIHWSPVPLLLVFLLILQQVYWLGPVLGAVLAGVSHEFFFARSASRQKLVACLTCKDIEIVETASMTGSSLSTVTQNAMRAKQANKQENN